MSCQFGVLKVLYTFRRIFGGKWVSCGRAWKGVPVSRGEFAHSWSDWLRNQWKIRHAARIATLNTVCHSSILCGSRFAHELPVGEDKNAETRFPERNSPSSENDGIGSHRDIRLLGAKPVHNSQMR